PEWSMTATLMMPDPISRPTEVFLPNPNRAMPTLGLERGRERASYSKAHRLSCQASKLLETERTTLNHAYTYVNSTGVRATLRPAAAGPGGVAYHAYYQALTRAPQRHAHGEAP